MVEIISENERCLVTLKEADIKYEGYLFIFDKHLDSKRRETGKGTVIAVSTLKDSDDDYNEMAGLANTVGGFLFVYKGYPRWYLDL